MIEVVEVSHQMKKPFRFWATPDTKEAWRMLMDIQTDFINTDKIEALSNYITQQ